MKILSTISTNDAAELGRLNRRFKPAEGVEAIVADVIAEVKARGDAALIDFAAKFDKVAMKSEALKVSALEFVEARNALAQEALDAMTAAHSNILSFAKKSLRQNWEMTNAQGARVGEVFQPFQRVGIYVPGGTAPLISTVLMTVTLAQAAGCEEIVVCTPCDKDGKINPEMLCALQLAGATEVYKTGGSQAIAAMAFGTNTIRPVDKIYGPGNKYVVEAKRQVFGTVAIDLLPGPSEILVLCDASANPAFVAADLLAQAEHGHDGEIVVVTTSADLIQNVQSQILIQLAVLPRADIIREIVEKGTWMVLTADIQEAVRICNQYAPEHVSLVVENEDRIVSQIRTAGAIFLGNYSPVAAGDFVAGPSHTLPTGGAGKSFAGLTVDAFQRRTSIVKLDKAALEKSVPLIEKFSEMEGLQAHARSASIRLES